MTPGQAILVYAADGLGMRDEMVARIRTEATADLIEVIDEPARIKAVQLPGTWDNCANVILVTPGAYIDADIARYVAAAVEAHQMILPVVPDVSRFDFSKVPESLAILGELNAKDLRPDDQGTTSAVTALREIFGFAARNRMRQVFISYRRLDAEPVAEEIRKFLWTWECAAFKDTLDIGGGEPVQSVIMDTLRDKDFVLFIDSPQAPASKWIAAELYFALSHRIPVASVRLDPPQQHIGLLGANPTTDWDPNAPDRLERVFRLVSRGIGLRDSLDDRIERIVAEAARVRGLLPKPQGKRNYEFHRPNGPVLRLEYETGALTLERLHRLFMSYQGPPPCKAVYVGGDDPILAPTREALSWARQSFPLDAMTVEELFALLRTV